jgi:hypothetical protein
VEHNLDLFDLFDKYRNNTLTEKDILLVEQQDYIRDWNNFNTAPPKGKPAQKVKKRKHK